MKLSLSFVLFCCYAPTAAFGYSCMHLCKVKNWPEIKKEHEWVKYLAKNWESDKKAKKLSRVSKGVLGGRGRAAKRILKNAKYYAMQLNIQNERTQLINDAIKDSKKNKVSCAVISGGNYPYTSATNKKPRFVDAVNIYEDKLARMTCYRSAILEPYHNIYKEVLKQAPTLAPGEQLKDAKFEAEFLKLKNKPYTQLAGVAKTAKNCPYSKTCKISTTAEFAQNIIENGLIKQLENATSLKVVRPGRIAGPKIKPGSILPPNPSHSL